MCYFYINFDMNVKEKSSDAYSSLILYMNFGTLFSHFIKLPCISQNEKKCLRLDLPSVFSGFLSA